MKFLIDMPLSPELAKWLRDQKHDAVHAVEVGLMTSPDDQILDRARRENRTVITADLDFPRLFAQLEVETPGLILFRGGNYSEEETRILLARVLDRIKPAEIGKAVVVIDRHQIRKRLLPIRKS
ncbi:MAG: DUF5615 family PIN-like protein [Deltaproteobacteria bacterium]|nr:DUF5615 family PIN-like protein [Deltaproteobacteria bacterium]